MTSRDPFRVSSLGCKLINGRWSERASVRVYPVYPPPPVSSLRVRVLNLDRIKEVLQHVLLGGARARYDVGVTWSECRLGFPTI